MFGCGAIELDPHDAGSRRVGERRAEVVDEHLELRDAARARKSQRGEELAAGERLERGDRRAVGRHGLAARADDFAHSSTDRLLDRGCVGCALIAEERDITVEIADRRRTGAARHRGGERVALVGDPAQAITGTGTGQGDRGDGHEVRVRHVDDGRRVGTRSAMTVDERRAHRPQQALAPDDASLAGIGGLRAADAEEGDRRHGAPPAEGVLDGRLAEHEIGVARIQRERGRPRTGRRGMLRKPGNELAHGPVELEPDIRFARLRRVRPAGAAFLHTKRRATSGERVQAAAPDEDLEHA